MRNGRTFAVVTPFRRAVARAVCSAAARVPPDQIVRAAESADRSAMACDLSDAMPYEATPNPTVDAAQVATSKASTNGTACPLSDANRLGGWLSVID